MKRVEPPSDPDFVTEAQTRVWSDLVERASEQEYERARERARQQEYPEPSRPRSAGVPVSALTELARVLNHLTRLDVNILDQYSGPAAAAGRQALLQMRGIARNTLPIIEAHDCCAVPRPPTQPNGDDELA